MGILLDTSHLLAYLYERDTNHEAAREIMEACLEGRHGRVVTTTSTLEELAAIGRSKGFPASWATALDELLGPGDDAVIEVLHPSGSTIERAHRLYVDRYDQGLNLTDWVQVLTMEEEGLETIGTFDGGFHGLAEVVGDRSSTSP